MENVEIPEVTTLVLPQGGGTGFNARWKEARMPAKYIVPPPPVHILPRFVGLSDPQNQKKAGDPGTPRPLVTASCEGHLLFLTCNYRRRESASLRFAPTLA